MLRVVAALVLLALGASVVAAQNIDAIKQRQELMKANAKTAKGLGAMAKGKAPFDLAKVKAALQAFQERAVKLKALWPEDSKTGGSHHTHALPAIWEKKEEYLSWFDGFAKDAKAAETAITDEVSFKTEWRKLADYCGSCHKDYRAPMK